MHGDGPMEDEAPHIDYGEKEHARRTREGEETPGGEALSGDRPEAPEMPGAGSNEGSSHGG